jgi:hypothetical protein
MVVRFRNYTTGKRVRVRVGIGTRHVLLVLVVLTAAVGLCCCNEDEEEEGNVEGEEIDEELRRSMHELDELTALSTDDIIASFPPPSV